MNDMADTPLLKIIMDAASTGILSVDALGIVRYCNAPASTALDFDVAGTVGQHVSDSYPKIGQHVSRCLETGKGQLGRHIRSAGKELVLDVTPIMEGEAVQGAVCCIKDMNEFEQAALQLESYKRLNKQFETVFNASSDGIWVLDNTGVVIDINKTAEKYIGVKAEEVIGKNIEYLVEIGTMDRAVTPEGPASHKQTEQAPGQPSAVCEQNPEICAGHRDTGF